MQMHTQTHTHTHARATRLELYMCTCVYADAHNCQVRRELHFMPSARLDGLKLRVEEFGKKTTQFYDGSKDNLVYRSASYHQTGAAAADASATPDALAPRKMTEKFRRDVSKDAEDDVIKRTFGLVGSGAIKVGFAAAPLPFAFDHRPSTLSHPPSASTFHLPLFLPPHLRSRHHR